MSPHETQCTDDIHNTAETYKTKKEKERADVHTLKSPNMIQINKASGFQYIFRTLHWGKSFIRYIM